nr:endonuclease/exonuclease/phosphatase family protein [Chitinophaga rhizophila]
MFVSKFLPRLLIFGNVLITISLLLSAWLPYLNPQQYWLSGFAGLTFLICWGINLAFLILWLVLKNRRRYAFISLAGILFSLNALYTSIGTNLRSTPLPEGKTDKQFTLMTFNASNMGLDDYQENPFLQGAIYQMLQEASPDILCMQEFYTNKGPGFTNHIDSIRNTLHYPYHFFTNDMGHWDYWQYGIILFSRLPILRASRIPCGYSSAGSGSSFLQADLLVAGDTVRVITVQLKSYMFKGRDYDLLEKGNGSFSAIRSLAAKMKHTIHKRAAQSQQLAGLITQSPYKVIVCGDFNDTPVSYTYNTISMNMQDAFLHKGRGIGRTLSFLAPTLRIDYILAQRPIKIRSYNTFYKEGFQHVPVMTSLSL